MLARFPVVLENGHADPGTGHTPTIGHRGIQLSKSPNWTKFRLKTQESMLPETASGYSKNEVAPDGDSAAVKGIEILCT